MSEVSKFIILRKDIKDDNYSFNSLPSALKSTLLENT